MLTPGRRAGFSLVEVVVALTILSVAVLGLASAASRLTASVATAELRAMALVGVEDRLSRVRLDPRYGALDSLYTAVEEGFLGIPGMTRTTVVERIQQATPVSLDYTRVGVTVRGPMLDGPLSRAVVVAAP